MKKITTTFFKIALTAGIAAAIGFTIGSIGFCRLLNAGCPAPSVRIDTINTKDFASQTTAHQWSRSYDSLWRHIGRGPVPLHYFTIRSQDLLCAMGIDTAWQYKTRHMYIRLTIGYSDSLSQLKAYIQPVIDVDLGNKNNPFPAGKALFFNKKGQIVDSLGQVIDKDGHIVSNYKVKGKNVSDDPIDLFVGDLNTPCPSTCGN